MESRRVTIRLPAALYEACFAKAAFADLDLSVWLRNLAEEAAGVKADLKPRLSGLSPERRKQIAKSAARARWGR